MDEEARSLGGLPATLLFRLRFSLRLRRRTQHPRQNRVTGFFLLILRHHIHQRCVVHKGALDITEEMFAAIGHALTSWSSVEDSLCTLFCHCVGPANGWPTREAYWAIISFEARLKMVDAVMSARFPPDSLIGAQWTNTNNRLIKRNRTRNKIAHGTVVTIETKAGMDIVFAPFFWGNIAKTTIATGKPIRPHNAMDIAKIREATERFDRAASQLRSLAGEVFGLVQLPEVQKRAAEQRALAQQTNPDSPTQQETPPRAR